MKYHKPWLMIIAFTTGFVLMGYEIFGSRILQPYFGSEIHVWGSLIAVFMTGLSVGYLVGGKVADKFSGHKPLSLLLFIPGFFLFLFPLYGKTFCVLADRLEKDERIESLIASLLLFFIPSLFLGAISPYLVKLNTSSLDKVGSSNGTIYAVATAGSIIGTLTSAFYLVGHDQLGSNKTIALFGLVLIVSGTANMVLHFRQKAKATPTPEETEA